MARRKKRQWRGIRRFHWQEGRSQRKQTLGWDYLKVPEILARLEDRVENCVVITITESELEILKNLSESDLYLALSELLKEKMKAQA